MKQITQTKFKKGQTEFENISSPETDENSTRIVSLSVNQYGEFQFTTDGEHYTAIEPKILPITSIDTIYQDESELPENQTDGTILPTYTNGSLPIKLYKTTSGEWQEINEVEEFSFYLPLDSKLLYTFLGGQFTPVVVTKTSELTNDAGFLTSSDISSLSSQVATNTNDLAYLPLYNRNEYKAFAIYEYTGNTSFIPNPTAIPAEFVSRYTDLQVGDKILAFVTIYNTNPQYSIEYPRKIVRMCSCTITSISGTTIYVNSTQFGSDVYRDRIFAFKSEIPAFETNVNNIKMDGTASVGSSSNVARADHIHPSDTSKQDVLSQTQLDAVNSGIDSTKVGQIATNTTNIGTNTSDIATINGKIPNEASSSNQLADKNFVNSSIQTQTAHFRGNWATWSAVPTDVNDYPADDDGNKTPTSNDYMVVQDASGYTAETLAGTWRFKYSGVWATNGKNGWLPEYQVNETPLTAQQLAALNSGITSSLVTQIGTNQSDISGLQTSKQNTIDSSHKLSADLVEDGTTNKVFTATEQTKLSGIESGAEVNDVEDVKIDGSSVIDGNKNAQISTINGNYNASSNKIATQSDLPANITITTTSGSESVSDGTNTLNFGANAFTNTAIPTTYVSSVNGSSGAITNVAKTNAANTFSAEQTFTGNIKNSGTYYIGSSNAVLSSISGTALTIGDSGATLNLVGSGTLPKYNGNYLALDGEVVHLSGTQIIAGLKTFTTKPQVNGTEVALVTDIPTIPPIPTVNDATITITQGGVTKGSFTLNQSSNDTIALDAGGGLVTDVQVDSASVVSSGVADVKTINGNYNASTNKIATASDLPQVNNASLYLQLNGNAVKTFTANASSDVTANIQALPNYSLSIGSTNGGNPRQVLFTRVNYTNFDSNSGAYFKLGAMSGHGNGSSYTFVEDVFINVNYQGTVTCNVYKYVQQSVTLDGVTRNYGDIFWTIDTTNKIVDFYILLGQYSSAQFTPATKIGAAKAVTTANGIIQYSGTPTYYSSGTKVWANGNGYLYATTSNSLNVTTLTADANLWDLDVGIYQGKDVSVYYGTYSGVAQSVKLKDGRTLFVGTKSTEVGAIYIGAGYVYEVKCALDGSTYTEGVLTTEGRVASSYLKKNMSGTITGNSDTPLTLKSNATASYLGFQNSSGTTLGYYGVNASNRPVFYYGSDHALAYTSDIPDLLSKVYPVGSIYLSVNNTSPASFLGGTWEQIGANYALWTATSGAGSTISAGLPNITGYFNDNGHANNGAATGVSGAFYNKSDNNAKSNNGAASDGYQIGFEASRSNSIYGNSSTVQPPAYKVYAWKRTA